MLCCSIWWGHDVGAYRVGLSFLRGVIEFLPGHLPGLCHRHVIRGSDAVGCHELLASRTASKAPHLRGFDLWVIDPFQDLIVWYLGGDAMDHALNFEGGCVALHLYHADLRLC